jgi:hypothetical protein
MKHSEQTREELRRLYADHPESNLLRNIARRLAHPVQPLSEEGRFRPHPVAVWIGIIAMVAVGAFLYFTQVQP